MNPLESKELPHSYKTVRQCAGPVNSSYITKELLRASYLLCIRLLTEQFEINQGNGYDWRLIQQTS